MDGVCNKAVLWMVLTCTSSIFCSDLAWSLRSCDPLVLACGDTASHKACIRAANWVGITILKERPVQFHSFGKQGARPPQRGL